jgi:hypothetical protein
MLLPRDTIIPTSPQPSAEDSAETKATRQAMVETGTSITKSHVNSVHRGCPGAFGTPAHMEAVAISPDSSSVTSGATVSQ